MVCVDIRADVVEEVTRDTVGFLVEYDKVYGEVVFGEICGNDVARYLHRKFFRKAEVACRDERDGDRLTLVCCGGF
jgi:hypothetical protein